MAREIYNEGRVAGLSAYEIYVRQSLAENPTGTPATESEWLAATLTAGSSMILTVPVTTVTSPPKMLEFTLPENSKLAAGTTLVGSFFHGTVHMTIPPWADYVTSYGDDAILNNSGSHPSGWIPPLAASGIPWTTTEIAELNNYMRIIDGVAVQAGQWSPATAQPPQMDLTADFSQPGKIRLVVNGSIDTAFKVLLTGFDDETVVASFTSTGNSVTTPHPENGDFLGPTIFPWASKIIFTTPTAYMNMVFNIVTAAITNGGGAITDNITMGATTAHALSMANAAGTLYPISNPPATADTPTDDTIYWAELLSALVNNHKVDIIGVLLRALKGSLSGTADALALALTGALTVNGAINANSGAINTTQNTLSTNKPFIVGANYIQFGPSGPRLYVSSSAPSGARSGDYGIGW
jgi:hypothetical protein